MDPIADFLSQINNAYLVKKKETETSWSKAREALAKLLVSQNYLEKFEIKGKRPVEKKLVLILKYFQKKPALKKIKRISKPGRKFYVSGDKIPWPLGGGITIISTSRGLMIGKEARKKNLGGEVICQIW